MAPALPAARALAQAGTRTRKHKPKLARARTRARARAHTHTADLEGFVRRTLAAVSLMVCDLTIITI